MIEQVIYHYKDRFESVLEGLIDQTEIPATPIFNAIRYALFPGGKRLRPLLVYLCGEIVQAPAASLDIIATGIELTHCYSLIHDDLPSMDNDDFRRGKPSCHKAFDEATAILVGDGMQALAIEILLSHLPKVLDPSQVIQITRELVSASGPSGMVSGQSLDLTELANSEVDESLLCKIHSLKTGKLILACINMVIHTAPANKEVADALEKFAQHFGLVFQIQDDYLDHYGKDDLLGKGRASDLANEKITFANLYTQEELNQMILHHYQLAKDALSILGQRAHNLLAMITYLQQRSSFYSEVELNR